MPVFYFLRFVLVSISYIKNHISKILWCRRRLNHAVIGKNIFANSFWSVNIMTIKRGDIYYADLSPVVGSEQGGVRPVLIVQNDVGNKYSPTVIAAAITSQRDKTKLPTHIKVDADESGLAKDSIVLLEQIRTIDKQRLKERMGRLDNGSMNMVDRALSVSFGLNSEINTVT